VLAREIANLAGLRGFSIAKRHFTALVGIQVSSSESAVSIGRNGLLVDVVD
jgi:hypothetical protein